MFFGVLRMSGLAMLAVFLTHCDGPGASGNCTSGPYMECELASCRRAERHCEGDPPSYGPCECILGKLPEDKRPELGGSCARDADCPQGAFCLLSKHDALFGGGPPDGVCTATCTDAADICDMYKSAICVDTSYSTLSPAKVGSTQVDGGLGDEDGGVGQEPTPMALCLPKCSVGGGVTCEGEHVGCEALDPPLTDGYCRPLCTVNSDCPKGSCDPKRSVCVSDTLSDPSDIGTSCKPDSASCAGECIDLGDSFGTCAQRCVFGSASDCAPALDRLPGGACLIISPSGGVGDVGHCGQLCDCADDCAHAQAVCDPFNDATLERTLGRKGTCTSPAMSIHPSLSCGG